MYFEDIGAGGVGNCDDAYYSNIPIRQNGWPSFYDYFDGGVGYTGQPQFQAAVVDMNGNYRYINTGELYQNLDHAEATAEIATPAGNCPSLTNGLPYQHFGATYTGTVTPTTALYLNPDNSGNYEEWGEPPHSYGATPFSYSPYWRQYVPGAGLEAFRTNGPSSSNPPA